MRDYSENLVWGDVDVDDRTESPVDSPPLHNNAFPSSSWNVPQGSYVMAFDMSALEERAAVDMAQRQLPQLQGECERSSEGWRRIRGKKGSSVKLWEKGCTSSLTTSRTTNNHASRRKSLPTDFLSASSVLASEGAALHATYAVRSAITVHAPIETVLKVLDCSLATSYRSFTKIMYEQLVVDTSVLYHSSHSTTGCMEGDDAVAVRWLATKCQNPLTSDCDFCLVEYTKMHSIDELIAMQREEKNVHLRTNQETAELHAEVQSDGLRDRVVVPSAYKIIRSMETKYCPELQTSHHLVRTHVPLGGYLLYETDHCDVTDVVFYMSLSYEGNQPSRDHKKMNPVEIRSGFVWSSDDRQVRAIQQVMQHMALGIGRIRNAVDAHAMSLRLETLRTTKWVENSDRMECIVCYRRFHPLARRRHHCRLCGEVICRNCSVIKDADLPTVGPTTLRICMLCDADHFDRTSSLTAIQQKPVSKRKTKNGMDAATRLRREALLETTTMQSPIMSRQKRHNSLFIDDRRHSMSNNTIKSTKTTRPLSPHVHTPSSIHRENVADPMIGRQPTSLPSQRQPMSCPKPSAVVLGQPQSFAEKWKEQARQSIISPASSPSAGAGRHTKAFFASRERASSMASGQYQAAVSSTASNSRPRSESMELPPQSPINSAASCSKAATMASLRFGIPRKVSRTADNVSSPTVNQPSSSDSVPSPVSVWTATPTRGIASSLLRRSSFAQSPTTRDRSASDNQQSTASLPSSKLDSASNASRQRIVKLDDVTSYEVELRKLCVQASAALHSKFAAISVFVSDKSKAGYTGEPRSSEPCMAHYLVVDGAPTKLLPIAANMKCCGPILDLLRPIATRDARTASVDGYVLSSLPIVKGPQQTRFYAGVPLINSKERVLGAVVVFDPQTPERKGSDETFELETVATLQQVVVRIMPSIEEKQRIEALTVFTSSPLLRLSEPEMKHLRPHASSSPQPYIRPNNQTQNQSTEKDGDNGRQYHDSYLNEEDLRSLSLYTHSPNGSATSSHQPPKCSSKQATVEYYKHQMRRLVEQAQRTQDQMLQNTKAMQIQGVS